MSSMLGAWNSLGQDRSVLKQEIRAGTVSRMLRFAVPYSGLLGLFLVVVIADALIGVVDPLICRRIINDGILKADSELIVHLAIVLAALGVVDGGLGIAQAYLASKVGAEVVLSLRRQLFEHIQQMPLAFFARTQTGALITRLNADVGGARSAFTDILSNVVGNLVTATAIFGAMIVLSWPIATLALVLVPLFVLPARFWERKWHAMTRDGYDLIATMNSLMIERFNVAGALLAKLFGRPREEIRSFNQKAAQVSEIAVKQALYVRLLFTAPLVMAAWASALTYGWGGQLAIKHTLDVGTIIALIAYLTRLYSMLLGLSNVQVTIMTALVSFERVFELLDLPCPLRERPSAVPIPPGPARISFDHVSFSYPTAGDPSLPSVKSGSIQANTSKPMVLRDINFELKPGQVVALVGPSGAGKTTITHLVPRLYDVEHGAVRINGIDVRDATLDSLRERIGVITQDAHLFHDTIRANLRYAKPHATDHEIKDALRDAQILDFVESLPDRLDTIVGERGYRLSGGEKQRIAIARLLLKSPDIAILDEATAHLDTESEAAIQQALESALAGRTCVVIAHRLSTILKADLILVVQDGMIVQRGSHATLLSESGLYAKLYRHQFKY